jgi:hypothetical protein
VSVVSGVGDEQQDAINAAVSALQCDLAMQRLDIAKARFGLDGE